MQADVGLNITEIKVGLDLTEINSVVVASTSEIRHGQCALAGSRWRRTVRPRRRACVWYITQDIQHVQHLPRSHL
jgi:hypothetical protein